MHYFDYKEQAQHGTSQFPFAFYHVDGEHPRYHMPYHWHQEYEIIRILEGTLTLSLDSEEFTSSAGDIFFIHDGVIHGGTPDHCVYECIVFDLRLLPAHTDGCRSCFHLLSEHKKRARSFFPSAMKKDLPAFFSCTRQLFSCASSCTFPGAASSVSESFPGQELMITGLLAQLFGTILQYETWETTSSSMPAVPYRKHRLEQLRSVLQYIEYHYAEDITLDQLSSIAGMSPKYFCRFFDSIIHQTPIEYLNYYRIERACYELSLGELSVTEVGYNCGFHDTSYFIRIFKREKGVTPRTYQKELLQNQGTS